MKKIIVAIDGYSSCGKSTMAKALAKAVGYTYVDTGAMYRAVGLFAMQHKLIDDAEIKESELQQEIENIRIAFKIMPDGSQHTLLNGVDVEKDIRTLTIADYASRVSALGFVRRDMVAQQQAMGKDKGIVMDGRDIATVVFPEAELKIFVTASAEVRAKRRFDELQAKGDVQTYEEVLAKVKERDYRDTHRAESPLCQAQDARVLDNSDLSREEQSAIIMKWFDETITG